ncbi:ABC transporter permease [Pseudarthrobacter albicanus]|uniref:ABC transporter permease n=1 Tax=Pseudarthrobacter albicanus TaxID=2823873 RepID=UPI001BAE53B1|nr:ABC transporter permease [Pseudarthrobacter albicanus]
MFRYALRALLAHKVRLLLTVAAITVGVAFVSGSLVLSDTMGRAFDELFAGLAKGTDVTVRAQSNDPGASLPGQVHPLDESIVETVRGVSGVASAEGSVTGFALILDRNGQPIQPGGAPTLGGSVHRDPALALAGGFSYRAGRAPAGPDEMALDAGSARKAGYVLGDRVRVVFPDGTGEFTVMGLVGFGDTDSLAGATLASFDTATAQRLLGKTGKVDQVDVRAEASVAAVELRDRISQVLPPGTQAVTSEQVSGESSKTVRDGLGIFTTVLLVFAGISLLVGSFVIWNTFAVLVAQRRREVALLRAVGATRGQVLTGIITEAVLVGLVSAGFGLGAGVGVAVGLRALLSSLGIEVPATAAVVEPRTIVTALLVGVLITVVSALVPAVSATRVAPMEALRSATPVSGRIGRVRTATGVVLLAAGTAGLTAAALMQNQLALTGVGALTAFAGIVVAGPQLARGIAAVTNSGRPGGGWSLASRNISRVPRRAAATAMALTVGLAVVCAVSVTASSIKASAADLLHAGNRSDLILRSVTNTSGMSPAVADIIKRQTGVDTVVEWRYSQARVNGNVGNVVGVPAADLGRVVDLGIATGSLADFRDGTILLSTSQARELNAGVGDSIKVTFPETGQRSFQVAATFDLDSLVGTGQLLSLNDYAANVTSRLDDMVMIKTVSSADTPAVRSRISHALAGYPNVLISDPNEFVRTEQASIDQAMGLVTALLALSIVVAALGIINTLALSVMERTREIGLMRAVGATRRQVRGVIRRESLLMSLFGALMGVLLGTVGGVALARSLPSVPTLSVPIESLAVYVLVAAVIGVLAAIGPARRSSRVNVLKAISAD